MNMREQAITQKQGEGWFQDPQTGKWKRFRSATVGKDGHEIDSPSQPPPMIIGTNNTIVSAAYEPKFLDNAEIREYPLGTEVAQPLTKAQLLYKPNPSKQKYQAKQEANAAMAMKAQVWININVVIISASTI